VRPREALAQHPFARGLTSAHVDRLATCAQLARFTEGDVIFRDGGLANALYLITSGRVVLEQHVPARGTVQLENLVGGDLLGLSWLFPEARWILDARAVEPTEVVVLDAECVRACMAEDPVLGLAIATHVIHQLYQRLERVRLQRLDVYRADVR
jgi:CRP-like cAMP-binding protein